jgi:hypothetical protein
MQNTSFYSVKGGAGCTTTAVAYAMSLVRNEPNEVHLRSVQPNDARAICGVPQALNENETTLVAHNVMLVPMDFEEPRTIEHKIVTDYGVNPDPDELAEARAFCVLRPCYLHLNHYLASPIRPEGIVLINEPGRSLGRRDVEDVCGVPVVTEINIDLAVARAIDAGILAARLPQAFARSVGRI